MQLWEFLWEFCWGLFAESRKLGRNYPRRGEYQPPAHKDPSSEFKEAAECWEESASATSKHTHILPESYLRNVKSEVWIVKVHFVLPLALKSSYLAAIVFLKLTVRNVYATVHVHLPVPRDHWQKWKPFSLNLYFSTKSTDYLKCNLKTKNQSCFL